MLLTVSFYKLSKVFQLRFVTDFSHLSSFLICIICLIPLFFNTKIRIANSIQPTYSINIILNHQIMVLLRSQWCHSVELFLCLALSFYYYYFFHGSATSKLICPLRIILHVLQCCPCNIFCSFPMPEQFNSFPHNVLLQAID